jgi:hypothetical protein
MPHSGAWASAASIALVAIVRNGWLTLCARLATSGVIAASAAASNINACSLRSRVGRPVAIVE